MPMPSFHYSRDPISGQPPGGPPPHPAFAAGGPPPSYGGSHMGYGGGRYMPGPPISHPPYIPQPSSYAVAEAALHMEMALRAVEYPPQGPLPPPPGLSAIDGNTGLLLRPSVHPSQYPVPMHFSRHHSHQPPLPPSLPATQYGSMSPQAGSFAASVRDELRREAMFQRAASEHRSHQVEEAYRRSVAEAMQRAADRQRLRQEQEAAERYAAAAAAASRHAASRHQGTRRGDPASRHGASHHARGREAESRHGWSHHSRGREAESSRVDDWALARRRMERAMVAERHPYARG